MSKKNPKDLLIENHSIIVKDEDDLPEKDEGLFDSLRREMLLGLSTRKKNYMTRDDILLKMKELSSKNKKKMKIRADKIRTKEILFFDSRPRIKVRELIRKKISKRFTPKRVVISWEVDLQLLDKS